jgi:hypothetical protein
LVAVAIVSPHFATDFPLHQNPHYLADNLKPKSSLYWNHISLARWHLLEPRGQIVSVGIWQ